MAVQMGGAGRVAGYKYQYDFCVEDEIIPLYKYRVYPGNKTLLFEIRTNFIIKTREGGDEITGSESFYAFSYRNREFNPSIMVACRLEEYWMSKDEIQGLFHEALDFGRRVADDPVYATYSVIPVVVKLEVCTVQQEREAVEAAMDRALRAEHLVPLYLCPVPVGRDVELERRAFHHRLIMLLWNLPRIRVTELNQGLALMSVCGICSRAPTIGDQISLHPSCSHAFHSHCIVRRLLETNLCPMCDAQAYDPHLGVRFDDSAGAIRSIMEAA